jgi:hypothetical protein
MRSPTSVWRLTNFHSSSVSGPGLSRISSGIASFPMSCSDAVDVVAEPGVALGERGQ